MADSPSKTGRPDARDRRGNTRAARGRHPVRVRARAPSALAARRKRGTACLGARSGVPQGDPAAVLVVPSYRKKKSAHFFSSPVPRSRDSAPRRLGARVMTASPVRHDVSATRVPTAVVSSSIPRGAFSFRRDTPRIEPPSRARATVASTSHPAATARERASLARPRAGPAASPAAHVGAGARVRGPLHPAGCD